MIVRELITMLGFSVDKAGYARAERAYDQMQGHLTGQQRAAQGAAQATADATKQTNLLGQAVGMMQRFAAQAGISNLLKEYVTLASDANETSGALGQLFGKENLSQIETWSQVQGAAMGRSQYDLQAYAARLGSVLGPVTKSREEAQRMAQSLSELSVDLGSFFNTRDEDAMAALRSGLTGEYESLKRYGIVLNDVTLAEVASARGIKKKVTQMTTAEKTELRYQAILDRTKDVQGDAVRTGQGFANASKALKAQLKDLGIAMAKTVIPKLEGIVRFARDGVTWFNKVAKQSHVLEAAMYTLAAVAGILALEFYSAFVVPAIGIAALILIVDELWTTLEGGDSALREFIDGFFGVGTTAELVKGLHDSFAGIVADLEKLDARGTWDTFAAGVDNVSFAVQRLIEKVVDLLGWLNPVEAAMRIARATGLVGQGDAEGRATRRGIDAPVAASISDEIRLRQRDQSALIARGVAGRAAQKKESERAAQYGPSQYSVLPTDQAAGFGVLQAPVPASGGGGPAAGAPTVNLAAPTIIINGGDTDKVKRIVTETLESERKKTMAAVGRRGGS